MTQRASNIILDLAKAQAKKIRIMRKNKLYRERYREELKIRGQKYRETHKELIRMKKKLYVERNKEKIKQYSKEYHKNRKIDHNKRKIRRMIDKKNNPEKWAERDRKKERKLLDLVKPEI
jgi:hypothetical protein